MRAAYSGAAGAWAAGPAAIYRIMAMPLVTHCPLPLDGARVLEFGAGTGATTAVIAGAGARVVATDLSSDMLAIARRERPPAAAADALALPFRPSVFDAAMGAFVLSHIPDPVSALAEVARCIRTDGVVMTIGFCGSWEHAVKAVVEETVTRFGFERPAWYESFKREVEPRTAFPDQLEEVAVAAGLDPVVITAVTVDTAVRDPDDLIAWRLGNPSLAPFMAGLDAARRDELLAALRDAIGLDPDPLVPELLIMTGRVSAVNRSAQASSTKRV
jgi:SAM-dependent methyltransferase